MTAMLRKKEHVTIITPIPGFIPRQLAIDILHSHSEVITLNPLVLDHKAIKAPRDAASDEFYSTWYEIIERIQYIPGIGKMGSGKIAFRGCFHDMPWGLQAHIYAPMNTDLRYKYRIDGNQPGVEPPQPLEMGLAGLGAPSDGLYLREDVEVKCSIAVMSFVKSQLKAASKLMVQRIIKKAELVDAGVLHAMIENGRLKTINPADRSTNPPGSTPAVPPLSPSTSSPSPALTHVQADLKSSPQPGHPSPAGTPALPGTPSIPYQVPRPQSLAASPYGRPDSANTAAAAAAAGHPYQTPPTPGYPAPGFGGYPGYGYPGQPGHPTAYPPGYHPGHASYIGHPGYGQPQLSPNMYPPQPFQSELQGYPVAVAAVEAPPVEMAGDHIYPTAGNAAGNAATTAPPSSVTSTPRSNADSDILPPGQWSAPTSVLTSSPRPTSTASDASAGAGGFRSPGLDKGFSSDLTTHRETHEEHRAETLKKLDPTMAQKQPNNYDGSDYGTPVHAGVA